jgi:phosphoglycolate phosphatase
MLPPLQAILFDFDGTLAIPNLDFADMHRQVWARVRAAALPEDVLHGLDILELVERATALLRPQQPHQAQRFYREAQEIISAIEIEAARRGGLLPGILELLEALQRCQIGVGIVTRNCNAAVRLTFPDLDRYCQAFIPRERTPHVKPHPAHLETALIALGTTPQYTLMVGDGAMDIRAGKALGMFSVGVLSGSGSRVSLLTQGADLVLESAADLQQYLPLSGGLAAP